MGATSYLDPQTRRFECGMWILDQHSANPSTCMHCQTQRVGSETQQAVYYIGCRLTVAKVCIHLLSSQSPEHPTFDPFPLTSPASSLGPLGPIFSTLYGCNDSVSASLVYTFVPSLCSLYDVSLFGL